MERYFKLDLQQQFYYVIGSMKDTYGASVLMEHEHVYEFFEGSIPLFKLIYNADDGAKGDRLVLSFHLDLDSVDAIQWYLRVKNIHPAVYLTECYYKDDNDETFLGQGAELIRRHKEEQSIIANWTKDEDETKEFVERKIVGRVKYRMKEYDYTNRTAAEREFNKLTTVEEKEECH